MSTNLVGPHLPRAPLGGLDGVRWDSLHPYTWECRSCPATPERSNRSPDHRERDKPMGKRRENFRVNRELPPFEQIRKFRVLDREFTIERGEVTPTMKIRRGRVLENFRDLIGEMYMGREEMA